MLFTSLNSMLSLGILWMFRASNTSIVFSKAISSVYIADFAYELERERSCFVDHVTCSFYLKEIFVLVFLILECTLLTIVKSC